MRQTQITGYTTSSLSSQLFKYSGEQNKLELARMISMEYLSFSFGEKDGFVNYCQKILNHSTKRVTRNTLKHYVYNLYKQEKKNCKNYLSI